MLTAPAALQSRPMDDPTDDDYPLLSQNDPCSDSWDESSFLGRLIEEGEYNEEGYEDVEETLIRAVADGPSFQTLGAIIRIIEQITLMLKRHVDPGDAYRIDDLSDGEVMDLDRRVRFCLTEISLGNAPDLSRLGS
jgi:hypothetical protein